MLVLLGRSAIVSDGAMALEHLGQRRIGDLDGEAAIALASSEANHRLCRLVEAARHGRRALDIDGRRGRMPPPEVFHNLGTIAMENGRLLAALEYFELAISVEHRHPSGKLHLWQCHLALAYCQLGQPVLAHRYAVEAYEASGAADTDRYRPRHLATLARVQLELGEPAKAYSLGQRGLDASEVSGGAMDAPICLVTMAEASLSTPDKAIELAESARERARASNATMAEVEATVILADAALRLGRHEQARYYASDAVRLAHQRQYQVAAGLALTVLAEIHHAAGEPDAAARIVGHAIENQRATGHRSGEARSRELLTALEQ